MDLELSDDQFELRDNIRSVLEGACSPQVVRDIYEGTDTADRLWQQMVELYWPALGVPEAAGGLGLGFVEVGLLAEELGRAAAPGPLLAVVSQFVPMLVEAGAHSETASLLAETAEGTRVGALAFAEGGRWTPETVSATAERAGDGWSVTGVKDAVLGATMATCFAVAASTDAGVGVFLVEAGDARVEPSTVIDPGMGLASVSFDASSATELLAPGVEAAVALTRVAEQAATAMALHTVGACRRIFEVTIEYAKVREQYDRIIGSFQALKHRFAELYLAVERANAVCYYAALAIAEDDDRRTEAAHIAKAAAGDCASLLAEDGLQLHGGIGYTWENDLHFLLKRAKSGEVLCGAAGYHRAALADLLGLNNGAAA